MKTTAAFAFLSLVLCCISPAQADTFGSGLNTFVIDFVTIGNPGNADDTTGNPNPVGKVDSTYRIGKFEISEDMIDKANTLGSLDITESTRGPDKPATSVNWFEAAKFVNWLNTSTSSTPAYKFDGGGNFQLWLPGDAGYNPNNLYRNSQATYFLPSVDEWYKAAYYDPNSGVYFDYPTGSDTAPTAVASGTADSTAVYIDQLGPADITLAGGLSPYGTMGQGGNVWEWEETDSDLVNDSTSWVGVPIGSASRGIRGDFWGHSSDGLSSSVRGGNIPAGSSTIGFRVASAIPEPSSFAFFSVVTVGLLGISRCFVRSA